MIKIIRNSSVLVIIILVFIRVDIGIGIRRTISISNTRKITARRKNRRENGIRADEFGSNPHSNGVVFSRSVFFLVEMIRVVIITTRGKIIAHIVLSMVFSIT